MEEGKLANKCFNREKWGGAGRKKKPKQMLCCLPAGQAKVQSPKGPQRLRLHYGPPRFSNRLSPRPPIPPAWLHCLVATGVIGHLVGSTSPWHRLQWLLTLGFASFAGKVEGLAVAAAGRLGGAADTKPAARLMGFLFDPPKVVGAGCLGRGVGWVLAFDVEVFAGWVVAKGFKLMCCFVFLKPTSNTQTKIKTN